MACEIENDRFGGKRWYNAHVLAQIDRGIKRAIAVGGVFGAGVGG
jgi:hypothetical protein